MDLDQMKGLWQSHETPDRTPATLKTLTLPSHHPVIRRIRRQLLIEIAGWTVFLFCYYTMFDGERKPLAAHVLLIVSVAASLFHNIVGLRANNLARRGDISLLKALSQQLGKTRRFAVASVLTRAVFAGGLLAYFCWDIEWTTAKYVTLAIVLAIFAVQLVVLSRLWRKRISSLNNSLQDLMKE